MACSNKKYTRATLQEDELLSEEVKKYPSLYDKKMKDYKDRNVANNGWMKVAMSLSICDSDGKFRVFIFVS